MCKVIRFCVMLVGSLIFLLNVNGQPPRLNSLITAPATIFLDFDGQYVTGTSWNWLGPISAQPSGLSNTAILEIFNRVAEDYRPFNLNITTDSTIYFLAPFDKRIRIIITRTFEWYGKAGGISYVGSFTWGNETPAWVFSGQLSSNIKYTAEACSHEIGHTLGLQHLSLYDENCEKISEYNDGKGDGEIGWAPIMGLGYYKNLTTWSIGPNTEGCNNIQNDLFIIGGAPNDIGFRPDDHSNEPAMATDISLDGLSFSVNGLINSAEDTDAFRLKLNAPVNLRLDAVPQNVGPENAGANIDIQVVLKDANTDIIGVYNPPSLLGVAIDTNLQAGTYYIMVSGIGNVNQSGYGSLGSYSLGGRLGVALPIRQFILKADISGANHLLSWQYNADEMVKNIIIEASQDGKVFDDLVTLNAEARTFSYKPFSNVSYYRIKAVTIIDERAYYSSISKIVSLQNSRQVQLLSNMVQQRLVCNARNVFYYRLFDTGGKMLLKGRLEKGVNTIELNNISKGIYFLHFIDSNGGWVEKFIKQ